MAALAPWNPYRELEDVHNRLSSLFNQTFRQQGDGDNRITASQWLPLVDITESASDYVIKAELPEIKRDDVKVTVERGLLTLSGERKFESESQDKRFHRVERSYGRFVRSFAVPEDADATKVSAEFKDGILSVRLPKAENAQPRQIDVQIS